MQLDYQKCRIWGHAWDDFIPAPGDKRPAPWGRRFSLRCERCSTERHDVFDGLGQLSTRHYDYAPDYQLNIDERPTTERLRLSVAEAVAPSHTSKAKTVKVGARRPMKAAKSRRHLAAVAT